MKAFIAGATGALGMRVTQRLVTAGHDVVGLTRSDDGASAVRSAGAVAVIGDLLDAPRMQALVAEAAPDVVFELVNALPPSGPRRFGDLEATNRLRDQGTAILLEAAVAAGAARFIAESVIFAYGYGDLGSAPLTEETPVQRRAPVAAGQPALDAMHRQEEQVLQASAAGSIDGVVLRVGTYYGAVPSSDFFVRLVRRRLLPVPSSGGGRLSFVHIDDAADAVVLAAQHGRAGTIYNVVGDQAASLGEFADALADSVGAKRPLRVPPALLKLGGQYLGLVGETNLVVDNTKAKAELQWRPAHATIRDGVAADAGRSVAS